MKNTPAYRQAGICGVIRPPHGLGGVPARRSAYLRRSDLERETFRHAGVARSRSLFVATPSGPLTVSRACQELLLIRRNGTPHPSFLRWVYPELVEGGALHLSIFAQP
jgi:hypothetical protein